MKSNALLWIAIIGGGLYVLSKKPIKASTKLEPKPDEDGIKEGEVVIPGPKEAEVVPVYGYIYNCSTFEITDETKFKNFVNSKIGPIVQKLNIKDKKMLANIDISVFSTLVITDFNKKCLKPLTLLSRDEKLIQMVLIIYFMRIITGIISGFEKIPAAELEAILQNFNSKLIIFYAMSNADGIEANEMVNSILV